MNGPFFAERAMRVTPDSCCGYGAGYDESLGNEPIGRETWCSSVLQKTSFYLNSFYLPLLRRVTINTSVRLLLRVLYPRVGCPHGVTG